MSLNVEVTRNSARGAGGVPANAQHTTHPVYWILDGWSSMEQAAAEEGFKEDVKHFGPLGEYEVFAHARLNETQTSLTLNLSFSLRRQAVPPGDKRSPKAIRCSVIHPTRALNLTFLLENGSSTIRTSKEPGISPDKTWRFDSTGFSVEYFKTNGYIASDKLYLRFEIILLIPDM